MITVSAHKIKTAVEAKFTVPQIGVYNRRYIAGTTTWSQHAWGNACDFMVYSDAALGDKIYAYLIAERQAGRLPIGTILWRVKNHYDHLHVEGSPKQTGTPPQSGDEEMEVKELIKNIQTAINATGVTPKLTVDGIWGVKTQNRFQAAMRVGPASTGVTEAKVKEIIKTAKHTF